MGAKVAHFQTYLFDLHLEKTLIMMVETCKILIMGRAAYNIQHILHVNICIIFTFT